MHYQSELESQWRELEGATERTVHKPVHALHTRVRAIMQYALGKCQAGTIDNLLAPLQRFTAQHVSEIEDPNLALTETVEEYAKDPVVLQYLQQLEDTLRAKSAKRDLAAAADVPPHVSVTELAQLVEESRHAA